MNSYGTLAHGVVAGSTGVLAILAPKALAAMLALVCGLVGVAVPGFVAAGGAPLAFAGLFLCGLGVKDVHTAVTSPKASSGLLCAESSVAVVAVATGASLGEPFFYVFAAVPSLFTAWALAEMSAAKAKKKTATA